MKKLILTGIIAISLISWLFAQETKENKLSTQTAVSTQIGNKLICPVTGEEFPLTADTPKLVIEEKIYYFCCKGCAKKFSKEYQKKISDTTDLNVKNQVVCPVMGTEFVPNSKSPKTEYKGKTYYFCCPDCVGKFNKEPEKYISKAKKKCCGENSKETKHKH